MAATLATAFTATTLVTIPMVGSCCSETESLRSLLGGREAEAVVFREQARKEREELVSRLLTDKERYGAALTPRFCVCCFTTTAVH